MANIESKMNWQVKQYMDGTINYEVHDTGECFGTICVPTGGGKSGMMIRDMIWHIDHLKRGEKLIINLSAPMLNLCGQLAEDIFSVIKDTHANRCANGEFAIFINSSANEKYYKTDSANSVGNVYEFGEFDNVMANNLNIRVALVISCHMSLKYFAHRVNSLKKSYKIVNYLDESHVLINFTQPPAFVDFEDKEEKLNQDERSRKGAMEMLLESNYLYCFSATPDKYVTKSINRRKQSIQEKMTGDYHIYEISPLKLIHDGIIVNPNVKIAKIADDQNINAQMAIAFMNDCKNENPNIHHKILISCKDSNCIENLEDELNRKGCIVFSTCANNGAHSNVYHGEDKDERGNFTDISQSDFVKKVDEYDGDCYVLHIRQLRAGIDIKTLTDCIIETSAIKQTLNDGVKIAYVQTIGRILRPYMGERGRTDDNRLKKNGNVLFLIKNGEYEETAKQTTRFAMKYYGLDGVKAFRKLTSKKNEGSSGENDLDKDDENDALFRAWAEEVKFEINEMKENVFKFVKENVFVMAEKMKEIGGNYDFNDALRSLRKKFSYADTDQNVGNLFKDYELMNEVSDLLRVYGIKE